MPPITAPFLPLATPPTTAPAAVEPAMIATLFFVERLVDTGARDTVEVRCTGADRVTTAGRFTACTYPADRGASNGSTYPAWFTYPGAAAVAPTHASVVSRSTAR